MMVAEEVSIALGISKLSLSLSSTSPNTSSSSPNGFFQIQPGSLLTTNPAVILHLGRVCAAL